MNHICSVLKYLCLRQNATILVTNLAIKHNNFTENKHVLNQDTEQIHFKPAIGKYWNHIPHTRLMITTEINKQTLYINNAKSVHIPMNKKCILNIDDSGVF